MTTTDNDNIYYYFYYCYYLESFSSISNWSLYLNEKICSVCSWHPNWMCVCMYREKMMVPSYSFVAVLISYPVFDLTKLWLQIPHLKKKVHTICYITLLSKAIWINSTISLTLITLHLFGEIKSSYPIENDKLHHNYINLELEGILEIQRVEFNFCKSGNWSSER